MARQRPLDAAPGDGFPGLRPGDSWCLRAATLGGGAAGGVAPRVVLLATHEAALRYTDIATLKAHAVDLS